MKRSLIKSGIKINTTGLMHYYKFDGSTKDEVTDVVNGANVSYATGVIGKSAYFGSYSPLKYAGQTGVYSEFTISLWVNADNISLDNYRGLFVSRRNNESNEYGIVLENKNFIVYENTTRRSQGRFIFSAWTMITFIVTGGKGYLYINGILVDSFTYRYMEIADFTYIGCDNLPVNTSIKNRGLKGYIDEMSIWNRALSGEEVNRLYNDNKGLKL